MIRFLFIILSAVILLSCGEHKKEAPAENVPVSEHFTWAPSLDDSSGVLKMTESEPIPDDSLSISYMLNYLNHHLRFQDTTLLHLELVKQSGDTIFVHIPDPFHLTQSSGSTGAEEYMATMIYNLTEIPGIKYVHFDFEEGDHAQPGLYARDSLQQGILPLGD